MPETSSLPTAPAGSAPARPRFSWPMRLFLSVFIFDMVFHSLAMLTPYNDWCDQLEMRRYPYRLPTPAEIGQLEGQADARNPDPVTERVMESLDSVWVYFRPWPSAAVRAKTGDWAARGQFALCWLTTRLGFLERLAGINQKWTMFSPSVATVKVIARTRLTYADGSQRWVRVRTADPEDITHYAHWLTDRINDYEVDVHKDAEARLGYCNVLANRYRTNAAGSPLVRIHVYRVTYDLPPPDVDAAQFLRKQAEPPDKALSGPFFVVDVTTGPDGAVVVRHGKL